MPAAAACSGLHAVTPQRSLSAAQQWALVWAAPPPPAFPAAASPCRGRVAASAAARDGLAGLEGFLPDPQPAEDQQQRQQRQQQQAGRRLWPGAQAQVPAYPYIDLSYPGLECVHAEPPVYVVHAVLSAADCDALRRAAQTGALPPLAYDQAVLLDTHRLAPLLLVVAAGAAFDAWNGLGAGAGGAPLTVEALLEAAAPALAKWAAAVGGVAAAALAGAKLALGGRVFTGSKWTAAGMDPRHPAAPAVARFLRANRALLGGAALECMEPPTVTRYRRGERQAVHFDGRPTGDPSGLQQFMEAGGQRLVQSVCYLDTLAPEQGGGTRFAHPALQGLTVQGDLLLFFPAFADGRLDGRMAHEGLPVQAGEKWIVNTWTCQRPVPAAVTRLPAARSADTKQPAAHANECI